MPEFVIHNSRGKRGAVGGKSPNERAGPTAPLQLTDGTTTASGALPIGAGGTTTTLPPRTGIRTDRDTIDITMMTVIHEAKADLERHDQVCVVSACNAFVINVSRHDDVAGGRYSAPRGVSHASQRSHTVRAENGGAVICR